jgi:hypothetical protein
MTSRAARWYIRLACCLLLLQALAHLVGFFAGPPAPGNDTEATLLGLMSTYERDFAGLKRTVRDFLDGFSLSYSLFLAFIAALDLLVVELGADNRPLLRAVAAANLIMALAMTVLALAFFIYPPAVLFALAAVAFALALNALRRPGPAAQPAGGPAPTSP